MNRLVEGIIANSRVVLAGLILLLMAGWVTYKNLPKELWPDIQLPFIYIMMTLEGVSPDDAERLLGMVPLAIPCLYDNTLNEALFEVVFTTRVMEQDFYINCPIQADIWISSTLPDAGLLVRVTDVAPDGSSREITNGILTASLRAVDESKSRFMDGAMIRVVEDAFHYGFPREAQAMAWVAPAALDQYEFPPADRALIERLRRRVE